MQEYVGLLGTLEEEEEGASVAMTRIYSTGSCDDSGIYDYFITILVVNCFHEVISRRLL